MFLLLQLLLSLLVSSIVNGQGMKEKLPALFSPSKALLIVVGCFLSEDAPGCLAPLPDLKES